MGCPAKSIEDYATETTAADPTEAKSADPTEE